jgi:hypothetical protein
MRLAVSVAVFLLLATACTSRAVSNPPTSTATREIAASPSEVAYAGNWPDDAQDLIRRRIPGRPPARIYCGNLYSGKGDCYATWSTRNGSECRADFSFYARGAYLLDATGGVLIGCSGAQMKTVSSG